MDLNDIKNPGASTPNPTPASGSSQPEKRKVGILLGVGIFIMPYIFAWFTLRKGHTNLAKGFAFGWFAILVIANLNAHKSSSTPSRDVSSTSSASAPVPQEEKKAALLKESCLKVSDTFGASSQLSDLQKDELWNNYKGRSFKWKMSVTDVRSETFGSGFSVQYKCQGSHSLIQDVIITYPSSSKQMVLGLQKGGVYEVQGTLDHFSTLLGLTADAQ